MSSSSPDEPPRRDQHRAFGGGRGASHLAGPGRRRCRRGPAGPRQCRCSASSSFSILSFLRFLMRAVAWRALLGEPAPLSAALAATISGDALGNITPFGLAASEPAKAFYLGRHLDPQRAFAALAAENFFYSVSVAVYVIAGVVAMLSTFERTAGRAATRRHRRARADGGSAWRPRDGSRGAGRRWRAASCGACRSSRPACSPIGCATSRR